MVYFGAGMDVRPVLSPHAWTQYVKDYVYIDQLPAKTTSYPMFEGFEITKFSRQFLYHLSEFSFTKPTLDMPHNRYFRVNLSDGRKIHYFCSTTVEDVISGKAPLEVAPLLKSATMIFMKEFAPTSKIFEHLPNLSVLFTQTFIYNSIKTTLPKILRFYPTFGYTYDGEGNWLMDVDRIRDEGETDE